MFFPPAGGNAITSHLLFPIGWLLNEVRAVRQDNQSKAGRTVKGTVGCLRVTPISVQMHRRPPWQWSWPDQHFSAVLIIDQLLCSLSFSPQTESHHPSVLSN